MKILRFWMILCKIDYFPLLKRNNNVHQNGAYYNNFCEIFICCSSFNTTDVKTPWWGVNNCVLDKSRDNY